MRSAVRSNFVGFTVTFEGSVPTMYPDKKGLITIGDGNLIDPKPAALALTPYFVHIADGKPAFTAEVDVEWELLHANRVRLADEGWRSAARLCRLRLTPEGLTKIVQDKLAGNEHYLVEMKGRFPEFSTWCCDMQMLLLSIAWACGPAFSFPKFEAACHAKDWATVAVECWMGPKYVRVGHDGVALAPPGTPVEQLVHDPKNPGLHARNLANVLLALNTGRVESQGLDPDVLYWPGDATAGAETGDACPDTQPEGQV